MRGRDPYKSNIAGDYEVNCTLCELDAVFSPNDKRSAAKTPFTPDLVRGIHGYYDKKFIGKGFETIYDEISGAGSDTMSNDAAAQQAQANSNKSQNSQSSQPPQSSQGGQGKGNSGQQNGQSPKKSGAWKAGAEAAVKAWRDAQK